MQVRSLSELLEATICPKARFITHEGLAVNRCGVIVSEGTCGSDWLHQTCRFRSRASLAGIGSASGRELFVLSFTS
jgi:hypothetical protein